MVIRTWLTWFGLTCLATGLLAADRVQFSASLSPDRISYGDTTRYAITIESDKLNELPRPGLPSFDQDLSIISRSQSTQYSVSNGIQRGQRTYTYVLSPRRSGDIAIEPATIAYRGKVYKTEALTLKVGGAAPEVSTQNQSSRHQRPAVFLEGRVTPRQVFVGEQVFYSLRLYKLDHISFWSSVSYDPPDYKGFWVEALSTPKRPYFAELGRQRYQVYDLIKVALFPINPGTITLDGAAVQYSVNPFEGTKTVSDDALSITVVPLPKAGRPADFSGLVGRFAIDSQISSSRVNQHTPITITITIKGDGYLSGITDLSYPESPDFKLFKSSVTSALNSGSKVSGSRTFEYIIIPKVAGELRLPVFSLSYFDLKSRDYVTLTTPDTLIEVRPNAQPTSGSVTSSVQPPTTTTTPYHPIRSDMSLDSDLFRVPTMWVIWALLGASGVVLGYGSWIHGRRYRRQRLAATRPHYAAFQSLISRLDTIRSRTPLSGTDCSAVYTAVMDYFAQRLTISSHELTPPVLHARLSARTDVPELCHTLTRLLEVLARHAYAPGKPSSTVDPTLISDIRSTLLKVEALIKDA